MRWKEGEVCVECNTADRPPFGRGLCRRCYMRHYREQNRDKVRGYAREWAKVNGARMRDEFHFDGNREVVLERDGHKCVRCGSEEDLTVHHKDRSGRGGEEHNNDPENLETVCRRCHIEEHREELLAAREVKLICKRGHSLRPPNGVWTGRQWQCRVCKTINVRISRERKKMPQGDS